MEAHDADLDERPVALGQLGGGPVRILARQKGHVPQQPRVLGSRQVRQRARPSVDVVRRPAQHTDTPCRTVHLPFHKKARVPVYAVGRPARYIDAPCHAVRRGLHTVPFAVHLYFPRRG